MKAKAILVLKDTNNTEMTRTLSYANPAYVPQYGQMIALSGAVSIKTACTALNALTTNTLTNILLATEDDITAATEE